MIDYGHLGGLSSGVIFVTSAKLNLVVLNQGVLREMLSECSGRCNPQLYLYFQLLRDKVLISVIIYQSLTV